LLDALKTLSGDAAVSLYRLVLYGVFVAAELSKPAQSFQSVFGSTTSGWSLSLPLDADQRARSLNDLESLFEALIENDCVAARDAMLRHLQNVQRITRHNARPTPSLDYPISYLFYYGRLAGPK
jgi:hypothetical protein